MIGQCDEGMQSRIVWNTPIQIGQIVIVTVRATNGTGGWAEATMPITVRSSVVSGYYTDPENRVIAFTPEQLLSSDFFVRSRSLTFEAVPPCGNHLTVKASYPGDGRWFVVGEASFAPGAALVEVTLGDAEDSLRRLPDEGILRLRLEWGGCARRIEEMLGDIRVDTLPPRFVHALAPAGDFYANLPDPETLSFDVPESANHVDFYSTDAIDFGSDPTSGTQGITYRVKLWRRESEGGITPVLYSQPFHDGNLPVMTASIGSVESFSGIPIVARGHYPTNVWSRTGSNVKVHKGVGEYLWAVEAMDLAGNVTSSTLCDLWVPWSGESLWCNLYSDNKSRFRVPVWMPRDRFVPAANSVVLNDEWSPYVDHPLVHQEGSIIQQAQRSWSPTVFHGDAPGVTEEQRPQKRNQQYAQYTWTLSRRWQILFEAIAEDYERQSRLPGGAAFSPYYSFPLLDLDHYLRASYSCLADGRLRLDLYRDPTVTEKDLYNPPSSFSGVDGIIYTAMGAIGKNALLEHNVLANCQDWSGFVWRWYAYGAMIANENATAFKTIQVYPGRDTVNALQLTNGGSAFYRSRGAGGEAGTNSYLVINAPDPLEVYHDVLSLNSGLNVGPLSEGQKYLLSRSLHRRMVESVHGLLKEISYLQRTFPLYEYSDGRYSAPGVTSPVHGSPSGQNWRAAINAPELDHTGPSWAKIESAANGHPLHELGHALDLAHNSYSTRGPNFKYSLGWVMGIERDLMFGSYQTAGSDPLRTSNSFCNWLLGTPEADAAILFEWGVGRGYHARMLPADLAHVLTHPVFHPNSTRLDTIDPIARVAWPRDASYIIIHDKDDNNDGYPDLFSGKYPVANFPPMCQIAEDPGEQASGIAFAGLRLYSGDDSPHHDFKMESEGRLVSWKPGALLFVHRASDFGYFDAEGDQPYPILLPGNPERVFRYPGVVGISTATTDWAGNVGTNAGSGVQTSNWASRRVRLVFDHRLLEHQESSTDTAMVPPHDKIRYVVGGYYVGTAGGGGTRNNPYLSVDYAVQTELAAGTSGVRTLILLPDTVSTPTVFYTHGINPVYNEVASYDDWAFLGGGKDAAWVVLQADDSAVVLLNFTNAHSAASRLVVGNMTLDGGLRAIDINMCSEAHLGNLVIRNMSDGGIRIRNVYWNGLFISNNTIVNCNKGITVERVDDSNAIQSHSFRVYSPSCVENNIVADCASWGIKIGGNNSARAWNPFSNAYGSNSGGNPLVPLRNNLAWKCGSTTDSSQSFLGDDWYSSAIPVGGENLYGPISLSSTPTIDTRYAIINGHDTILEIVKDPLFVSYTYSGSNTNPDFHLQDGSPALAAGNPMRLDIKVIDGCHYAMRRSIGAFEARKETGLYSMCLDSYDPNSQ